MAVQTRCCCPVDVAPPVVGGFQGGHGASQLTMGRCAETPPLVSDCRRLMASRQRPGGRAAFVGGQPPAVAHPMPWGVSCILKVTTPAPPSSFQSLRQHNGSFVSGGSGSARKTGFVAVARSCHRQQMQVRGPGPQSGWDAVGHPERDDLEGHVRLIGKGAPTDPPAVPSNRRHRPANARPLVCNRCCCEAVLWSTHDSIEVLEVGRSCDVSNTTKMSAANSLDKALKRPHAPGWCFGGRVSTSCVGQAEHLTRRGYSATSMGNVLWCRLDLPSRAGHLCRCTYLSHNGPRPISNGPIVFCS